MLSYTAHSLEKLEKLFSKLGYRVRYEKGNFKTGACILQNTKVVVVNRFLDVEAKIHSLMGLLNGIEPEDERIEALDEKEKQLLLRIKQTKLEI
ncbi:MAG TPA: hypothetical protein VFD72_06590 [Sphingobacteriaceae bacterium]|nr:hypothetical protein [Sphingobacteriaceae bacterium]